VSSSDDKPPIVEPPIAGCEPPADPAVALRIRQQEILADLGVIALRGTTFSDLLQETARLTAEGLAAEFCKVLEYQPAEKRFLLRAGVGWDPALLNKATVGADADSPAGYALHTGRPVISNQLENEQRFRTPELLARYRVRRAINVILQGDGAPYGVLEVDSRSEGAFSEKDIAFLQGAANIVGMAIERQRHERRLSDAVAHQDVLIKEINHRVKNSLQLVSSMLSLRASRHHDPAVRDVLADAAARVGAISRAHDRLYRSTDISHIELSAYLAEICRDLTDALPACHVEFASSGPVQMPTDRAIPLALLVTELIGNAAKHAYGDGGGPIAVRLNACDSRSVSVSISDEGQGIPDGFNMAQSTGLGMLLVRALLEQMNAQMRVDPKPKGVTFTVEAPLDAGE
jgi:two-component sensor histidine kinase